MSIWLYGNDTQGKPTPAEYHSRSCIFCDTKLDCLGQRNAEDPDFHQGGSATVTVFSCPICGWWKAKGLFSGKDWNQDLVTESRCSHGSLVDLATDTPNAPIEEVRRYLLARFEKRFEVHPRLVEESVAAVFKDLGYGVELTAYSDDGGIAIILLQSLDGVRTGVQIKRSRNTIGVDQIREFAGALLFEGLTKGVFVTTSGYTSGARSLEGRSVGRIPITLRDADWLFDALRLTQRPSYASLEEPGAPWSNVLSQFRLLHLMNRYNSGFANE